jgi:hypothetical protein
MLHEITTGWKRLDRMLNEVIRAVNQQKPLPSASIAIEESPNGTLLKVVGQGQDQAISGGAGGSGGGQQQPVIWHGVTWKNVTLIDPVTCAQTQAQILVKSAGGQIQIG